MAIAGAIDHIGHSGLGFDGGEEFGTAPGNQEIDPLAGLHQLPGAFPARIVHHLDCVGVEPHFLLGALQQFADCEVGAEGVARPAEDDRVAGFETEAGGVGRHIGPRLIDHGHHTERGTESCHPQPVGTNEARRHLPDRVGKRRHLSQAAGHSLDPRRGKSQSIEESTAYPLLLGFVEIGSDSWLRGHWPASRIISAARIRAAFFCAVDACP